MTHLSCFNVFVVERSLYVLAVVDVYLPCMYLGSSDIMYVTVMANSTSNQVIFNTIIIIHKIIVYSCSESFIVSAIV